jgi:hypothetical protein
MGRLAWTSQVKIASTLLSEIDSERVRKPMKGDIWVVGGTPVLVIGRVGRRYLRYSLEQDARGDLDLAVADSDCYSVEKDDFPSVLDSAVRLSGNSNITCFRPLGV